MNKPYILYVLILICGITVGAYMKPTDIIPTAHAMDIEKHERTSETFSPDSVITYMKKLNIKYIEFSFAQAQKESGHFSSNIFRENKNLFGMKRSYARPTPTIDVNRGHAQYLSWKESVIDFAILQASILAKTKNKKAYMEHINKYYSDNNLYVEEVNKLVEENRKAGLF